MKWKFGQKSPKIPIGKNIKGNDETLNKNIKTITTNNKRWGVLASPFYHFFPCLMDSKVFTSLPTAGPMLSLLDASADFAFASKWCPSKHRDSRSIPCFPAHDNAVALRLWDLIPLVSSLSRRSALRNNWPHSDEVTSCCRGLPSTPNRHMKGSLELPIHLQSQSSSSLHPCPKPIHTCKWVDRCNHR